jgi:RNA polymerase sigma-70 factor (ECF subfamily)
MNSGTVNQEIHRGIIEDSRRGDRRAQYRLYGLYSGAMYNVCLRMMSSREEAEDLLQDSFTEAFRNLGSFRYESSFGSWLKRIVVNRCINELKRKRAELRFFDDMSRWEASLAEPEVEETGLSPDNVKKAMQALPEGSRVVFSLYLLEGYDHREISDILGISESTSKTQYMHARKKVKEILSQEMI